MIKRFLVRGRGGAPGFGTSGREGGQGGEGGTPGPRGSGPAHPSTHRSRLLLLFDDFRSVFVFISHIFVCCFLLVRDVPGYHKLTGTTREQMQQFERTRAEVHLCLNATKVYAELRGDLVGIISHNAGAASKTC